MTDLDQQISFLLEADRLKQVERANTLLDQSRQENTAEHSWHVAVWALIFGKSINPGANLDRVIAMLLLHDLVEIDVGDHPIHLKQTGPSPRPRTLRHSAFLACCRPIKRKLFLWREFEQNDTIDAKLAKLVDTTQPIFQVLCALHPNPEHLDVVRNNWTLDARIWDRHGTSVPLRMRKCVVAPVRMHTDDRLAFLSEIDRLKSVDRATLISGGSRRENSAEHSWHLALMALVLAPAADVPVGKVVQMLLLHDVVEIDAGDTPIFGQYDPAQLAEQELAAADRIFGLLPEPIRQNMRAIWDEFEANETPEAKFAKSLDRFQPPLMNLKTGGGSWVEYNVSFDTVCDRVGTKIAMVRLGFGTGTTCDQRVLCHKRFVWKGLAPRSKS